MRPTDAFQSDVVLKVRPPNVAREAGKFKRGGTLVSWVQPAVNEALVEKLQSKDMTVIGAHRCWDAFVITSKNGMKILYTGR